MLLRRIMRSPMAAFGIVATAALGWAVKTQLDTQVGSEGLGAFITALSTALVAAYENFPVVFLALTIGLLIGGLISGAARRIDGRLKADARWSYPLLKREVGFARMICRRPWLAFLAQDAGEDMRRLSGQLALRGLPEIPPFDAGDRHASKHVHAYLDVIHPHLTEDGIEYALLCGKRYMDGHGRPGLDARRPVDAPIQIAERPVHPPSDAPSMHAAADVGDLEAANTVPAKPHLGGRRSRRRR